MDCYFPHNDLLFRTGNAEAISCRCGGAVSEPGTIAGDFLQLYTEHNLFKGNT
jgi:hypothetical protein